MAHFLVESCGNRGSVSRLGSKRSGIWSKLNGWDFGCTVEMTHENNEDIVKLRLTDGSNGCNTLRTFTFKKSEL